MRYTVRLRRETVMNVFQAFTDEYHRQAAEELSLQDYLQGCREDPMMYASAAERMIAATDAMADYRPSTMIDFMEGRPMEVEAIFGEPLRRAQALGVATPLMAVLSGQMRALNPA